MTLSLADLVERGETPVTDADIERFRRDGHWKGRTIRAQLRDVAGEFPDRTALVGYQSDGATRRLTYQELDAGSSEAANALATLGVGPGDAVAVMLPNWIDYPTVLFGAIELGAIYTGIPVSYGERQAAAILRRSKAKVLVIPARWRSAEHLEMSRTLRAQIPTLEHVVVVADDDPGLSTSEYLWRDLQGAAPHAQKAPEATDVCYLGFTSGTTGEPKGAMHTHETLLYSVEQLARHVGADTFGDPMVQLVASPTGHHTGFVWGVLFTVHLAGTGIHVDRWDPDWGVDLIRREGITTFFGAPTFLQDLMRTDLAGDPDCPLRCVCIAGSPVPRSLPTEAAQALGAYIAPAWGMTECSIIVACTPTAQDQLLATDGSVFEGAGVRVLDPMGNDTEPGAVGELVVKGPSLFLGYYDRPDATAESFLNDGWFRTGDTASLDESGWLSLHGRTKDIIIRGGENIPVTEIETLLFDHHDVLNAALIAVPDERLGERACAVVTLRPGAHLELADLCEYLLTRGLSKHFLPERLVVLDELPMTQSGKIQKAKLRGMV